MRLLGSLRVRALRDALERPDGLALRGCRPPDRTRLARPRADRVGRRHGRRPGGSSPAVHRLLARRGRGRRPPAAAPGDARLRSRPDGDRRRHRRARPARARGVLASPRPVGDVRGRRGVLLPGLRGGGPGARPGRTAPQREQPPPAQPAVCPAPGPGPRSRPGRRGRDRLRLRPRFGVLPRVGGPRRLALRMRARATDPALRGRPDSTVTGDPAPAVLVAPAAPIAPVAGGIDVARRSALADLREGLATVTGEPWIWIAIVAAGVTGITLAGPLEAGPPLLVSEHLRLR